MDDRFDTSRWVDKTDVKFGRIVHLPVQYGEQGTVKIAAAYSLGVLDGAYEAIGDVPAFVRVANADVLGSWEEAVSIMQEFLHDMSYEELPGEDNILVRIDGVMQVQDYSMDTSYAISMCTAADAIHLFNAVLLPEEADNYMKQIQE